MTSTDWGRYAGKRNVLGKRKVEISRVRMSPAFSAAPIGVEVSVALAGKSAALKFPSLTRMKKQQEPSALRAKR